MGIPIFVNSRDRVSSLKELLTFLPLEDVTIVDNASTYLPLLEFLENAPCTVVRLNRNLGKNAPWKAFLTPASGPYIVTDPDVIPQRGCPENFIEFIEDVLDFYTDFAKVGLGIDISDIPETYVHKRYVLSWESKHWPEPYDTYMGVPLYETPLDTTFAIYRSSEPVIDPSLRTGEGYLLKHLPWYVDSANLSDEELYYAEHADLNVATWATAQIYIETARRLGPPSQKAPDDFFG